MKNDLNRENEQQRKADEKTNRRLKVFFSALAVFFGFLILLIVSVDIYKGLSDDPGTIQENSSGLPIDDGTVGEWEQPKPQTEEEYIQIPNYGTLYVTDEETEAFLYNPGTNTVYFQYSLYEDGELVYGHDTLIEPGKALPVKMKEFLSVGEHEIDMVIRTYDIETKKECNSAGITVKVVVS